MGFLTLVMKRTRLSDITIDVDKDWNTKGITNIKQVAALMSKGDLVARDTAILVRIQPGLDGYVLTSRGALKLPTWGPAGGALKYFYPVLIESSHAEAIVVPNHTYNKNSPIASAHVENYLDDVPDNIKRLDPTVALVDAEAIVAPDQSYNKNAALAREGGLQMLVDGAISEILGVQVDETAQARSPAANDMTLLAAAPTVNDAYYIGFNYPFNRVWLNIGTAGNGNWALIEEYWNGAWVALAGVDDETNQFTVAGLNKCTFTKPGDWALLNILGYNLYWMRYRVSAFVNIVTQPKGTQAWCEILI